MPALRNYQQIGRDWLKTKRRAILGDEMRLGKTAQVITAAADLDTQSVIVVCPAIATDHWHHQWKLWVPAHQPELVTVSFEKFIRNSEAYLDRRYSLAVVDEFHLARNPDAQRTQLLFAKGGLGWQSDRMWATSGTPAVKHAGNLWAISRAFGAHDMERRAFEKRYCYFGYKEHKGQRPSWEITGSRADTVDELRAMMSKIMLRRKRREVMSDSKDPEFMFLDLGSAPVDLPDTALAWLDNPSRADKNERIEVGCAMVPGLATEIVNSLAAGHYDRTVVFCWHREVLEHMSRTLEAVGVSTLQVHGGTSNTAKQAAATKFNQGQVQVVVANILTAGTAIDLSSANHGYFLELDWLPGNNLQAANRLISVAKDEPVTFDVATWPGTILEKIQQVLVRRSRELSMLM